MLDSVCVGAVDVVPFRLAHAEAGEQDLNECAGLVGGQRCEAVLLFCSLKERGEVIDVRRQLHAELFQHIAAHADAAGEHTVRFFLGSQHVFLRNTVYNALVVRNRLPCKLTDGTLDVGAVLVQHAGKVD